MEKLQLPDWLSLKNFAPSYANAPSLTLPPGKVMAIDTLAPGTDWSFAKTKGFTHRHGGGSSIPNGEKFWTILANQLPRSTTCVNDSGNTVSAPTVGDAEALASQLAREYTFNSIVTDEFTDGSSAICTSIYWTIANAFYSKLSQLFGVGPETNNIMGGYMAGQNTVTPSNFAKNYGLDPYPLHPYYYNGLNSQALARKAFNFNTGDYSSDAALFSTGLFNKVNFMTGGYVGLNGLDESNFCYQILNEIQRKYAGGIKRTIIYTSPWSQAVQMASDVQWKNDGYRIYRPETGSGNYWASSEWHTTPVHYLQFMAFFGLLLADGFSLWDSIRDVVSDDPKRLSYRYDHPSRLQWKSSTGTPAPSLIDYNSSNKYPQRPISPSDIMLAMSKWYMDIKDIANASTGVKYVPYTTGATSVTVNGADHRIITRNVLNYGQNTLLQWAHDKRGLLVGAKAGSDWFLAYFNPYSSTLSTEAIVANLEGTPINLGSLTGRQLHVFHS